MNSSLSAIIVTCSLSLVSTTVLAATCESLAWVSLPNGAITSAENIAAGPFVPPGGSGNAPAQPAQPIPAHCRVRLVLKPSKDSHINAEVWLPSAEWNGKLMAVGNGGFGGPLTVNGYNDMQLGLRRGYVTAGNDTGHTEANGPEGMFGLGHPEKIIDFSHRAMHEMAVSAKRLIGELYGKAPHLSYYKGCSTGGRQGLMAAQRFPDDFDGIIAGAPANRHVRFHVANLAMSVALARRPQGTITVKKAEMVSRALLKACDEYEEGFVNDPRACRFDFAGLACAGEDTESCLTAAQLETVETFYSGVKDGKGEPVYSGRPLSSPMRALGPPKDVPGGGYDTVRIWAFQNEKYDWRAFDLDRDLPLIVAKVGFVDANDPDLTKFEARGGKLLLYGGWGDDAVTPENTVAYYESVVVRMGKKQGAARLFMVPGMGHCRGGAGPHTFDALGTLEAWREKGAMPSQITAFNPESGLSRPLCAYPRYAKYIGTGNMKDAANWRCVAP